MDQPIAIVLAAGKGTRMKSDLPKVLFRACGRPLIEYVLDAITAAGVERIVVVVGHRAELVRAALTHRPGLVFAEQTPQLGTGHAVQVCRPLLANHQGPVLVITGDSPLTQSSSLRVLLELYRTERPACILGSLVKENPHGLGRIVRDADNQFQAIVEEKDATPAQRGIKEVNMSTYVFDGPPLVKALDQLSNRNEQGEYYLTDCPGILKQWGYDVRALPVLEACEALSVNDHNELAAVEEALHRIHRRGTADA